MFYCKRGDGEMDVEQDNLLEPNRRSFRCGTLEKGCLGTVVDAAKKSNASVLQEISIHRNDCQMRYLFVKFYIWNILCTKKMGRLIQVKVKGIIRDRGRLPARWFDGTYNE